MTKHRLQFELQLSSWMSEFSLFGSFSFSFVLSFELVLFSVTNFKFSFVMRFWHHTKSNFSFSVNSGFKIWHVTKWQFGFGVICVYKSDHTNIWFKGMVTLMPFEPKMCFTTWGLSCWVGVQCHIKSQVCFCYKIQVQFCSVIWFSSQIQVQLWSGTWNFNLSWTQIPTSSPPLPSNSPITSSTLTQTPPDF